MGAGTSNLQFQWEYTDEPHAGRRIAILRAHPEIRKLMSAHGDRWRALSGVIVAIIHCVFAYLSTFIDPLPLRFTFTVCVGTWLSCYLMFIEHEAAHGLLFGTLHPRLNRWYALAINLVHGVPIYSVFRKHHIDHHKYQADDVYDVEQPTDLERRLFNGHSTTRFFWATWNSGFEILRAKIYGPRGLTVEEVINVVSGVALDVFILRYIHPHVLGYFAMSWLVTMGFGIFGVWGVVVHALFFPKEDTVSYYGWMNIFMCNSGYHMEHHDFPNIPSRYLPEVRRIAPEFYNTRHNHDSLYAPFVRFLYDPSHGINARLRRIIPKLHPEISSEVEFKTRLATGG